MVFGQISAKNDKFGYPNPILEKLGVTHDLGWWFLFALLNFFAIHYGSEVMRRNAYSSAVFTGGRPLWTQILPRQGRPPATILGIGKQTTDMGYPMVKTAPLCVPSFWHNTGVWRIDGQTDGYAVYTLGPKKRPPFIFQITPSKFNRF